MVSMLRLIASIQGGEHYHTPTDDFAHLNRNTAWHYLTTVLEFVYYAANDSLYGLHDNSSNAIFFMLLPGNMVVISYAWSYMLCGLAVLLAIAYLVIQIKNKCLKMSLSTVELLVLTILSIISVLLFHVGSYLFWLPLLLTVITAFMKKWKLAYLTAQGITRVVAFVCFVWCWFGFRETHTIKRDVQKYEN